MLLSIVIPVYNVADYLPECLASIKAQTFGDYEAICINDGSTDNSLEILEKAAELDPRIVVASKQNGGLSSARNAGIDMARGDIVMFLDSDDLLERRACERVANIFSEKSPDVLTFGATVFPKEGTTAHLEECLSPRNKTYESFSSDLLFKENSRPYVWRSAFSRSFIEKHRLRFDENVSFGEDQVFYFLAYPKADRTVLSAERLYRYRSVRSNSLMTSIEETSLKLKKHMKIVEAIFAQWDSDGLVDTYGVELIEWAIDFTAKDIASLNPEDRHEAQVSLYGVMSSHVGDIGNMPIRWSAKAIVGKLRRAHKGEESPLQKKDVGLFYLSYRGLIKCINRVVRG